MRPQIAEFFEILIWKIAKKRIGIRKFENSKHLATQQDAQNIRDFEKFGNAEFFRNFLCFLHSVVLQNVSNFRIFEFLLVFAIFEN